MSIVSNTRWRRNGLVGLRLVQFGRRRPLVSSTRFHTDFEHPRHRQKRSRHPQTLPISGLLAVSIALCRWLSRFDGSPPSLPFYHQAPDRDALIITRKAILKHMPDASLAEPTMFNSQESNYSTSLRSTTWAWGSFRKPPLSRGRARGRTAPIIEKPNETREAAAAGE